MLTPRSMALCALLAYAGWAAADDVTKTCQTTGWEMHREIAAFGGTVPSVAAGTSAKNAPTVKPGLLAALSLSPQGSVRFVAPPERPSKAATPLAGLVQFNVPSTGRYRVTMDIPVWLDAVSGTAIISSGTFNGWHECSLFRKTVEYPLQAGQVVTLQFSGAAADVMKILIEPVPTDT